MLYQGATISLVFSHADVWLPALNAILIEKVPLGNCIIAKRKMPRTVSYAEHILLPQLKWNRAPKVLSCWFFFWQIHEHRGLLPGLQPSAQGWATCKHLGLTSPLASSHHNKDEPHQKAGHRSNRPLLPAQSQQDPFFPKQQHSSQNTTNHCQKCGCAGQRLRHSSFGRSDPYPGDETETSRKFSNSRRKQPSNEEIWH